MRCAIPSLAFAFAFALVPALLSAPCLTRWAHAADEVASAARQEELAEVALLKQRGGHLAVHRLRALLDVGTPEVRVAALDALAHIGLRSKAVLEGVHRGLETTDDAERKTALRALGRLGDGRDLETFLGTLRDEDPGLREAALRGLRELTGRRLPVSPTRCSLWWRSSAKGLRKSLRAALDTVSDGTDRQAEAALVTLARDGWVDLDAVTEAARDWLRATDHRLRSAGFYLAAALRLADLAPDVESALPFVSAVDAEDGFAAARTLGLPAELMPPYWRRRLQERMELTR